jgi:MFS family permease
MLMDVSSEMIHALLPVYLVTILGASGLTVGVIEGIAEATASITKVFSGALSDWIGKRKWLAAFGYGLAALTKPIFPIASSIGWVVAARFIDRVGKGIRGAPRDALVADISPPHLRGASFGLRQSLDTVGAFLGPLIAIGLMWITADHFQFVFWVAVIPAFLSFALIVIAVREPDRPAALRRVRMPLSVRELRTLGATYWWIVVVATIFTLARFSEAFLVLKAQAINVPIVLIPATLVVMNVAYSLSAYPAGILADRISKVAILSAGLVVLVAADLSLAFIPGLAGLGLGIVLWGLHMGLSQGILAAFVAQAAPPELRGTAFGMYNLTTGIALLIASIVAGALWDAAGPDGTFIVGAGLALAALAALSLVRGRMALPSEGEETKNAN